MAGRGGGIRAVSAAFRASWLILLKAGFDTGAEVQSGSLGWMSLLAHIRPVLPDTPTQGLFGLIRKPIHVVFALTLWTRAGLDAGSVGAGHRLHRPLPCGPHLKERRSAARHGARSDRHRAAGPYAVPA